MYTTCLHSLRMHAGPTCSSVSLSHSLSIQLYVLYTACIYSSIHFSSNLSIYSETFLCQHPLHVHLYGFYTHAGSKLHVCNLSMCPLYSTCVLDPNACLQRVYRRTPKPSGIVFTRIAEPTREVATFPSLVSLNNLRSWTPTPRQY